MAVNVFGGRLNVVFGKVNIPISQTPIAIANTRVIFRIDSPTPASYNPKTTLNTLQNIEVGKGYLINAITDQDLEDIFSPPFPTGGGTGTGLIAEDGTTSIIPE